MKKTAFLKISCAAIASAIAALVARADIDINDNVSMSGYAAGSFTYEKAQSNSNSTADLDAAKLAVLLRFSPISGKVSIFTDQGAHQLRVLDAYGTCDLGKGFSITGGRFLTYIGYESFDIPGKTFLTGAVPSISVGNGQFFSGAPGYHDGIKVDFKQGKWDAGFAAVDSLYSLPNNPYRGDGSMRDGVGLEATVGYGDDQWKVNLSLAYEAQKQGHTTLYNSNGLAYDPYRGAPQIFIGDLWVTWAASKKVSLAGEAFYRRNQVNYDSAYLFLRENIWFFLGQYKQQISDNYACALRLSYGGRKLGNYWKVSVLPASYTITKNLELRAEVSYTSFSNRIQTPKHDTFAGLQAVLKF